VSVVDTVSLTPILATIYLSVSLKNFRYDMAVLGIMILCVETWKKNLASGILLE